jgi:hypothetical protein
MTEIPNENSSASHSEFVLPDFQSAVAVFSQSLLAELNKESSPRPNAGDGPIADRIPAGKRNSTLTSLAGTMRNRGMSQGAIEAALLQENKRCDPPLTDSEVLTIARSISRYPAGSPARRTAPSPRWPDPLGAEAFYGLAGDVVKTIAPHSEADEAALLIQTLTAFGSVVGHNPYFRTESDFHFLNLFCTLVGRTSKGRKGTSWKHVQRLFDRVEDGWAGNYVVSGLSSGEGLIWAVRDPVMKGDKVVDDGVTDKRLLVLEAEFASVLQVIQREGNTLSATVRQAWDSGVLRILTKKSPATATNPHISIVAHITMEELIRHLSGTEKANGFANRFLWVLVKRSKLLPEGGMVPTAEFDRMVRDLSMAAAFARRIGEMTRTEAARKLWREIYEELSEGDTGLFGAVTSRAEAQVVRLSCLYALLDRSGVVDRPHLEAALALWKYSEDSVRYLFGDALGDPLADQLLQELRSVSPAGLSRTEISTFFGRHKGTEEIGRVLNSLARRGLAQALEERTEGRPVERWFATQPGEKSEIGEETPPPLVISPSSPISPAESASEESSPNSPISQPAVASGPQEEEM